MKIEIPDIPKDLNPKGMEVEVSVPGQCKSGNWPLYLHCGVWTMVAITEDDAYCITARLVEPRYMFAGEMKTESECKAILDRDYERVSRASYSSRCDSCPFGGVPCPSNGAAPCPVRDTYMYCGHAKQWCKKQPVEEWVTPTDEDAKQRPAVQSYDREGTPWMEGRLLAVVKSTYVSEHDVYVVQSGDSVYCHSHCRMQKENKQ